MDTNRLEPEQEAAVPADLLQQEPHVEVADSKTSVDLSDEETLAAGVSTTRMQTKRLRSAMKKPHQRKEAEGGNLDG
jgi:hypothetical protein